jgi:hypothetical protein
VPPHTVEAALGFCQYVTGVARDKLSFTLKTADSVRGKVLAIEFGLSRANERLADRRLGSGSSGAKISLRSDGCQKITQATCEGELTRWPSFQVYPHVAPS